MKKRIHPSIGRLEALAFVSGFGLMAYELIAARILAPAIGSSTYIWTSVIGVIIAALAVGYFAGGKLADQRAREHDVAWLHIAAAAAIVWTLIVSPSLLEGIASMGVDVRLQAVIASLVLFAPASIVLGMISPYLAKLKLTSLETSGASVASLSAYNSIGGIVGTFVTGFFLFGYIGSRESLAVCVVIVLLASWVSVPRQRVWPRLVVTAGLLFVSGLAAALPLGLAKHIDTPSAHYQVVSGYSEGRPARLLATGPQAAQSGVYLDAPSELLFWYTKEIVRLVADAPHQRMLVLGGGAYTVPQYLARHYQDAQVDVVEIDPALRDIARTYFSLDDTLTNLSLYTGDARTYVNSAREPYDVVIVDVYSDTSVPFTLLTHEYGSAVRQLVRSGGAVIINVIGSFSPQCRPFMQLIDAAYRPQFAHAAISYTADRSREERGNLILVYSDTPAASAGLAPFQLDAALARYTDNFTPAERFHQQCQ